MPKLITVTLNTAIDRVVAVDSNGTRTVSDFAAGKGVNVARAANAMSTSVTCIAVVGEGDVELFSTLGLGALQLRLLPVSGNTRTNTSFKAPAGTDHRKTSGYSVSKATIEATQQQLSDVVELGDVVVLSGSLPPGAPIDTYESLARNASEAGATVVLDSSGAALRHGVSASPKVVKPNVDELRAIAGELPLNSENDLAVAARTIGERDQIEVVIVSRGHLGIVAAYSGGPVIRGTWSGGDDLRMALSVGAGDAFVGGFAASYLSSSDLRHERHLRLGLACATASLLTPGPGMLVAEDVHRLEREITIERLVGQNQRTKRGNRRKGPRVP